MIYIPEQDVYEIESFIDGSIMTISDAPWPGFTPDLLSIIFSDCHSGRGSVLVHQKCLKVGCSLLINPIDMGAQIILCIHTERL